MIQTIVKISFLLSALATVSGTVIGAREPCLEQECQCRGSEETEPATCSHGQFCVAETSLKMGCLVSVLDKHMQICSDKLGCHCQPSPQDLSDQTLNFCESGERCVALPTKAMCRQDVLDAGEKCLRQSCPCTSSLIDGDIMKKEFKAVCVTNEYCLASEEGPTCSPHAIVEYEEAKSRGLLCLARDAPQRHLLKPAECKAGATCLQFPSTQGDFLSCAYKALFHGQKCGKKEKVECVCIDWARKGPVITIPTDGYCAFDSVRKTTAPVSKVLKEGETCPDRLGCLCAPPADSALDPIFVGHHNTCKMVGGQLRNVFDTLVPGEVCEKAELCGCRKVGSSALCSQGQACTQAGQAAVCVDIPSIVDNSCASSMCLCDGSSRIDKSRLSYTPKVYCSKGQFCTSVRDPTRDSVTMTCFDDTIAPGEKCREGKDCICALSPGEGTSVPFAICNDKLACRLDTTNQLPVCVRREISVGEAVSKRGDSFPGFLCVSRDQSGSGATSSIGCTDGKSASCGLVNGKLVCARLVLGENQECPWGNHFCVCKIFRKEQEVSSTTCRGSQICFNQGNDVAACTSDFVRQEKKCTKDKCVCLVTDPYFPVDSSVPPPSCLRDEVCLATYGQPVCQGLLTPTNSKAKSSTFPNPEKEGTACAASVSGKEIVTRRCPPGTTCGLFGSSLECEVGSERNIITHGFFCTNRIVGCFCQKSLTDADGRKECGTLDYCTKDGNTLTCARKSKDTFSCPKDLSCYCGRVATREKKDQFCQLGFSNDYHNSPPNADTLVSSQHLHKQIDKQVLGKSWSFAPPKKNLVL